MPLARCGTQLSLPLTTIWENPAAALPERSRCRCVLTALPRTRTTLTAIQLHPAVADAEGETWCELVEWHDRQYCWLESKSRPCYWLAFAAAFCPAPSWPQQVPVPARRAGPGQCAAAPGPAWSSGEWRDAAVHPSCGQPSFPVPLSCHESIAQAACCREYQNRFHTIFRFFPPRESAPHGHGTSGSPHAYFECDIPLRSSHPIRQSAPSPSWRGPYRRGADNPASRNLLPCAAPRPYSHRTGR